MRHLVMTAACAALIGASSAALIPIRSYAQDTGSGARPGNVIGTGNSLPMSNRASNIRGSDTRSAIAPRLPTPSSGEDGGPARFLAAARGAIMAGHTGEAQEALERAESRLLDRDVDPRHANDPSRQPDVAAVANARRVLATGDRAATLQAIEDAMTVVGRP